MVEKERRMISVQRKEDGLMHIHRAGTYQGISLSVEEVQQVRRALGDKPAEDEYLGIDEHRLRGVVAHLVAIYEAHLPRERIFLHKLTPLYVEAKRALAVVTIERKDNDGTT
jgi:hypothetical protein